MLGHFMLGARSRDPPTPASSHVPLALSQVLLGVQRPRFSPCGLLTRRALPLGGLRGVAVLLRRQHVAASWSVHPTPPPTLPDAVGYDARRRHVAF